MPIHTATAARRACILRSPRPLRYRGGAGLARQAGQADRQLPTRRRRGHARPRHRARDLRRVQAAGRGRKPAGRQWMIGAEVVAKSPADGYTFLVTSGGAMTVDPFIYSNLPYDTQKDLTPVASLAIVRVFLLIHPSVPAKNLDRVRRLCARQPRQAFLRLSGQRQLAAPRGGNVQARGRHQRDPRSVQGRGAGAQRSSGRAGAVHVRPGAGAAACRRRQS